ncbi:MAG: putative manganese-dependent inorganic diphosphatase [Ruminococcaceae bacterium]|jgi:manganese-dependent inorganic pyrophosphatase|nr:putative manganese-dependent inorganic diphosphatase [Oscillospiraceae bacterium]
MKPVIVIGHKNPDSDSICSAICYANLKRKLTGRDYIACRAGEINNETKFILETFRAEAPQLVETLEPTLADVQYRRIEGISSHLSLRRAWEYMRDNDIPTVPVVTPQGQLKGILTLGDIARFYMEDQDANALAEAGTRYRNIVDTLQGEMVVGDPEDHFTKGKVVVAAANPDVMEEYISEHDMVLLGNRYESQLSCIEMKAGCIIVCLGSKVTRTIQKLAQEAGCSVVSSPLDTYACSKLINQAVPVRHVMRTQGVITFRDDDLVSEVKANVSKLRVRYFPILDNDGYYIGMISQRNLLDIDRQQVILVDHNEKDQAVDGIRAAEVIEVIDHHRIDSVETMNPIYFRNQPLGCTATIIALMYQENGVAIEPQIAGLLCSAILSDTLMFRSPTCTPTDERIARMLAAIAGIDVEAHATAMFNAGSKLGDKTPDEIFHIDCKRFKAEMKSLAVAQVTSVSRRELARLREQMLPYMQSLLPSSGMDMLFLMLTNIIDESTELLFVGHGAKQVVEDAFGVEAGPNSAVLPGVVSRKKQMMGPLITAIDAWQEGLS